MTFANPVGFLLLALAIPVLLLHVLRPRRPRQAVSSLLLWEEAGAPVTAARPWQRLRPSVLLFLQLLAVLLLALACAQPARTQRTALSPHTVFVLDASGSMAAVDGKPDRLALAKARATSLRKQLPAGGVASVVVASPSPQVLLTASPDSGQFADALRRVQVSAGTADYATAFSLAESVETPGKPLGVVFLSDGTLDPAAQALLPPGTRYEAVGSRALNHAVTRLTVEPRGSGQHARLSVRDAGGGAAKLRVRLDVDGRTATTLDVDLADGASAEREVDLPSGDRVEAILEGDDLVTADDKAVAVATPRPPLKVLVAGPANPFLDKLLAVLPGVTVERRATADPATGFDLALYDRVDPPPDPGAPFIAVAPPSGVPGVIVAGTVERPAVTLVRSEDALLNGLDLSETGIATAQKVTAGPGTDVLVAGEAAPLLLRGRASNLPFAYLAFALGDSNLPVQVAFPVLLDRLLTELSGVPAARTSLVVGATLPVPAGVAVRVDGPRGTRMDLVPGDPIPTADLPGFWTIKPTGRSATTVAVNADPREAVVAPASELPIRQRPTAPGERRPLGRTSLLPWVVGGLLALLAVELALSSQRHGVSRRQWRLGLVARGVHVALLVAALIGPVLHRKGDGVATVFLVDGSDSMGAAGRSAAVAFAKEALRNQPDGARAGVAIFGGQARLELTVQEHAELTGQGVEVDRGRTDLAAALRLAGAVLPSGARRRVVVVSDGRPTQGDAAAEAERLRIQGVRVDVHTIERAVGPDAAVSRVDVPRQARIGDRVVIKATIGSTTAGPAQVDLLRDGTPVSQVAVDLVAGSTTVSLSDVVAGVGVARYRVEVHQAGDVVPENDGATAAISVVGPARVLLVEGVAGEAAPLAAALKAGGLGIDVVPTSGIPPLDRLQSYQSTVLVDVDASSISGGALDALTSSTKDLGRGLVTIGGDHAYGLGGYLGSKLEALLPVVSDVQDPKRKASVAEVLAIDSSGSMTACHCRDGQMSGGLGGRGNGGVVKVDIAKAGARRAIEALGPNDQVGILAFDTGSTFVLPIQADPSAGAVDGALAHVQPNGGTDLWAALQAAADGLRKTKSQLRHIILFTDGFTSPDALAGARALAAQYFGQGITTSVVATGETGAGDDLRRVAEAGHGRFYPGRDLSEIPQILADEAVLATRSMVVEGDFLPRITGPAPAVRDLKASPALLGYIGTTSKATATTSLRIGDDDDPLLASWQAGLGKATSWTSDAAAKWSQRWATWDGYTAFWTAVVKDTFPAGSGAGAAAAQVVGDTVRITVESPSAFPDGATASARVVGPDLVGADVRLDRTGPTTFTGEAPATAAGTYAVGAVVAGSGGDVVLTSTALASQAYPAEYRPGASDAAALAALSAATGGRGEITAAQAFDASGLLAGTTRTALTGLLLLLAALLWPLDIALRRLALSGSVTTKVRSIRSRLPQRPERAAHAAPVASGVSSPPPPPPEPATPTRGTRASR